MAQFVANTVIAASILAIVALGFGLIYRVVHFFNFAHGALYTLGAYATLVLHHTVGMPFLLSAMSGVLLVAGVGWAMDLAIYRPIRRRSANTFTPMIASLGVLVVVTNQVALAWGDETRALRTGPVVEGIEMLGARVTGSQVVTVVICVCLYGLATWLMLCTKAGEVARAVACQPDLAAVVGIQSQRAISFVFLVGSALAAIAGVLVGLDTDLTPAMGWQALLMAVVAVVVGGAGDLRGVALGAILVAAIRNASVMVLPAQWQDAIVFGLLILFLLSRPQGILGGRSVRLKT